MPTMLITATELFQFSELTDEAKEKARDWYRECIDDSDLSCEVDEFASICGMLGIDLDTHEVKLISGKTRQDPNIYYDVGFTQGSGACFEGTYDYKADAALKLREMNNDEDWVPLKVAIALAAVQADNRFGLRATIKKRSHHYCHEHTVDIDVIDRRNEERDVSAAEKIIAERLRDLMRYFHKQLEEQVLYLHSDGAVDDAIEANEYTFTEEGRREG